MDNKIEIDPKKQLLLLFSSNKNDWEDKTLSVTAMYKAFYKGHFSGYHIYFRGGTGKFFYKSDNVQILHKIKDIDIERREVLAGNIRVNATQLEQFESGYYRIIEGNKTMVTRSITLKSNQYRDILTYYSQLANYAGTIVEENAPLSLLSDHFKRFAKELPPSVLIDFLQGEYTSTPDVEKQTILPFDFNQSQRTAIERALKSNISVVEGPPGTGKTQTILNLVASIVCQGKTCAVISNNNAAIGNVYEKLIEEQLSFIAARLGSSSHVQQFFEDEGNDDLTRFLNTEEQLITHQDSAKIQSLSKLMKGIHDARVEMALWETELTEIANEEKHHSCSIHRKTQIRENLRSKDYLELTLRLEDSKKFGFFEKWLFRIKFRTKIHDKDINSLLLSAESLYYQSRMAELKRKIAAHRAFLQQQNQTQVYNELKTLYRSMLHGALRKHYKKHRLRLFNARTYKQDFEEFTYRYPLIISTSHSLLNNIPSHFMFDFLIIDEASQGDLLSNVLALSCAKQLIVVGDSRQLEQIDEVSLYSKSSELAKSLHIPPAFRYESNSILKAVKASVREAPVTLLREHYRCAPDIINFCNKMFYKGELVVMTHNKGQHIEIIKTVPGNHARKNPEGSGWYNQREMDIVGDLMRNKTNSSVGVITPFRYQADCIMRLCQTLQVDLEADTIHKFQGRQKDEVILSFVVSSLKKTPENVENKLFDFITNHQLLNVAISRAKDKITVIVSDKVYHSTHNLISDFIKYAEYLYGSDTTRESDIKSVFDLLYAEYTQLLIAKYKNNPKAHKTELIMCELIDEVLQPYPYIGYAMHTRLGSFVSVPESFSEAERKYLLHPWTHVDFLFFNTITKEQLFVLEVDGIRFHEQNKKQLNRDDIKNRVLQQNNIAVYRFKTNESNEKGRLIEILNTYLLVCISTFFSFASASSILFYFLS